MKELILEIGLIVVILVLAVLLINPFAIWMPDMMVMILTAGLIVVFGFFASLLRGEQVRDEREAQHIAQADRLAFMLGSLVVLIGILVQAIAHKLDSWLVTTFAVLIITKLVMLIYYKINR